LKALEGIKVVDMTDFEAGPTCSLDLAFLGAEVYKIERPRTGKKSRPRTKGGHIGTIIMNFNKKSISVDLKSPEGKEILWKLIDTCDILVENMAPGAIDRLGFGYEEVKKRNPRIIFASIKGFGKGSPWEHYPAFDPVAQATGGAMSVNGELNGPPILCGPNIADYGAGHFTVIGILAALYQREKTGKGQYVEGAMQDIMACCLRGHYEPYYTMGGVRRSGNEMRLENVAPHNIYPCKPSGGKSDCDYVLIYCSRAPGSTNFEDLMRVIGREDLAKDPRMATPQSRYLYKEELDAAISEWTKKYTKFEAMKLVAEARVPAGAVMDLGEVISNEFLRARGTIVDIDHPEYGRIGVPTFPIKLSNSPVELEPAPETGEHSKEILLKLGYSEEEIASYAERGIVGIV